MIMWDGARGLVQRRAKLGGDPNRRKTEIFIIVIKVMLRARFAKAAIKPAPDTPCGVGFDRDVSSSIR